GSSVIISCSGFLSSISVHSQGQFNWVSYPYIESITEEMPALQASHMFFDRGNERPFSFPGHMKDLSIHLELERYDYEHSKRSSCGDIFPTATHACTPSGATRHLHCFGGRLPT